MERDLTINLLKKPRDRKPWRFSYRHAIYFVIFAFLLPIYFKPLFTKKTVAQKSTTSVIENSEKLRREQIKSEWDFLLNFFNVLNTNLPETANITVISGQQNQITLKGQIKNNISLNNFIDLLSKNLKGSNVSLNELKQKKELLFSILIRPNQHFSVLPENTKEASNSLTKHIIQNAEHSLLQINSIKPDDSGLAWQFDGSYAAIMYFLSRLKKNNVVFGNSEQVDKYKNDLF